MSEEASVHINQVNRVQVQLRLLQCSFSIFRSPSSRVSIFIYTTFLPLSLPYT